MYLWNIPEDTTCSDTDIPEDMLAARCVDNSDDTVYTTERLGKIPTTSFV